MRFLLYPFALLYNGITRLRNRLYDSGFFSSVMFDLPVISVGNLSAGGTGKTPHIEYLVRLLQPHYTVATMSRGYKRNTRGFILADETANAQSIGDEPMQYHTKFPGLVVTVAEERMTGIPDLLTVRPDVQVILLDDAYQHRTVKPGLSILLTEYSRPFYKDHVLPYGRLREARRGYRRADVIVISKCPPDMEQKEAQEMIRHIRPLPHQQVFFSCIRYGAPYDLWNGTPIDPAAHSVVLVCGIANPDLLIREVSQAAANVCVLTFPDHHYFSDNDLEQIHTAFRELGPQGLIVTTEKDAQRLRLHGEKLNEWQLPVAVLPVAVAFLFDQESVFNSHVAGYAAKAARQQKAPDEMA